MSAGGSSPIPRGLCLALIFAFSTFGARLAAEDGGLRFDRLSVEDGLSHSSVWTVTQDSVGFLWLGTQEGLNRHDGHEFRVYVHDPADPDSISESETLAIVEDRRGDLWIGTRGGGLNRFLRAEERFEHFRYDPDDPESLSHDVVEALLVDSGGMLWIGTGGGLNRLDPEARPARFERFRHDPDDPRSLSHDTVWNLYQDRRGDLWICTDDGLNRRVHGPDGVTTFERHHHDPDDPDSLSHDSVGSIIEDAAGRLWVGTAAGLDRFDRKTGGFEHWRHRPGDDSSLGPGVVGVLHLDSSGTLWIGGHPGGLSRLKPGSEGPPRSTPFLRDRHDPDDPHSLSSNSVYSILEDATGVFWLATRDGVNRYQPARERFVTYSRSGREPRLPSSGIRAIHQDRSGALWLGTHDGGLVVLDRTSGTAKVRYRAGDGGLNHDTVSALWPDRSAANDGSPRRGANESLWIGTWGGVSRLEDDRLTQYRNDPDDPLSLSHDLVLSLRQDARGRLWVGTAHGLNRLDPEVAGFVRYPDPDDPDSPGAEAIPVIYEDRSATLWFGSLAGGLYRLGGDGRFERLRHDPDDPTSLASDKIAAVFEDSAGRLWVGTHGGGLNRLDDPDGRRFVVFSRRDGLPSDTVLGILEDPGGDLWLATHRGLSRFDPRGSTFQNFDAEDGLQGDVFFIGSCLRGAGGELFFGGIRGLNAFFPDKVGRDPHPPRVAITGFQLFNQDVPLQRIDPASPLTRSITDTREITLSHRQYVIGFEFAALHYGSPRKNRYAYRLEDFDRDWVDTDATKRFAQYSNLKPGRYRFRVKASNGDGLWNEEGQTIRIVVQPPPWKSWWAYSLYGLVIAAAVLGYARWQRVKVEQERAVNRRLREVDRLKDQFLANTSHELRTPLYGIVGLAESLIDGATGELPESAASQLAMVVASARRLSGLVDDILDFSRLTQKSLALRRRPVDLATLTEVVLTLSRPLVGSKRLELKNAVGADLPPADADENRLQQILHNLIGNAIKFTETGTIEVSAVAEEGRLVVRVADTGPGIPTNRRSRIFEAFEQADASTEREFGGTGLGLTVTKQLVELHGGNLWVESTVGEGSTFFFTLPVAAGEAETVPLEDFSRPRAVEPLALADTGLHEPPSGRTGSKEYLSPRLAAQGDFHILVVDDEPVIRQVLVNHLAALGGRVTQASSGPEALRLLEEESRPRGAQAQHFDLVLLDIMMPKMSGYDVCRFLREKSSLEELPVIFLTAKNRVSDLVTGFASGANDYLTKPVAKNELLARVGAHLQLLDAHRRLERLLAERAERIEVLGQKARELEAVNAELERFTYTVSHDLKSPLLTIRGFLGLLQKDVAQGDAERIENDLRRIRAAAETMQELLEDLLQLSRVGRQANPPEAVATVELAVEAADLLAAEIAERGVELEIMSSMPAVFGDRIRLLQVLQNLLHNAVKFLGDQEEPRVEIGARQDGDETVIYVQDNGVGVDPADQERVFGLFEQLPGSDKGTGIGLALVKRIVEVHGGRIWVESEGQGRGSRFCFTLPRVGAEP